MRHMVLLSFLTLALVARAEESPTARELVEAEQADEAITEQITEQFDVAAPSEIGRTPLSTVVAIRQAIRDGDWETAAGFVDLRYLPENIEKADGVELLRKLAIVWGRYDVLDMSVLSNQPEGHLTDGLPSYRDLIGRMETPERTFDIFLQRVPDGQGGRVWKISNATIALVPELWEKYGYNPLAENLERALPDFSLLGMQNWQLVSLLLILLLSWPLVVLISRLLGLLLQRFTSIGDSFVAQLLRWPFKGFFFLLIAREFIGELGLSLRTRILLESAGGLYIAFTLLLIGLVDMAQAFQARKLERSGRGYAVSLLRPIALTVKCIGVVVMVLLWAENAGYNMSTILAGLGVSSVAVALAAQKTLENIIGAFTIYIARPIKPGDFCRFGTVTGTIEEIGLRSTLIRTLDRTLVHIPNAVFAAGEVENFSVRDKIRFFRLLRLRLDSSPDQLRVVLARLRQLLLSHPRIEQDTVQVRLGLIDRDAVQCTVIAYALTQEYNEYLRIAEDLNLRVLEVVAEVGAQLATPEQTVRIEQQDTPCVDARQAAETTIAAWREQDSLPFPDYSNEQLDGFRDSLDYPPNGSPSAAD